MNIILTNKCAVDFITWLDIRYDKDFHIHFVNWTEFPFNFQSGVYLEFFEAHNILIDIIVDYDGMLEYNRGFEYRVIKEFTGETESNVGDCLPKREDALKEAIIVANNMYNANK